MFTGDLALLYFSYAGKPWQGSAADSGTVDPLMVRWPHQQRQSVVMIDWRKHIAHPIVGDTLAHVDSTDMYVLVERKPRNACAVVNLCCVTRCNATGSRGAIDRRGKSFAADTA